MASLCPPLPVLAPVLKLQQTGRRNQKVKVPNSKLRIPSSFFNCSLQLLQRSRGEDCCSTHSTKTRILIFRVSFKVEKHQNSASEEVCPVETTWLLYCEVRKRGVRGRKELKAQNDCLAFQIFFFLSSFSLTSRPLIKLDSHHFSLAHLSKSILPSPRTQTIHLFPSEAYRYRLNQFLFLTIPFQNKPIQATTTTP